MVSATAIRNATESETFDLAGQTTTTIEKLVHDAFSEPLPLSTMIRITFVTGAGKLGRQKYDEGAAKAVTSTLRELGFEEDRGASAVLECAGSFKLQHDTGKNLKTVVVFPNVTGGVEGAVGRLSLEDGTVGPESLLPEKSPEHKIAYSSMNVFDRMMRSMCQTWGQKKTCVQAIESIKKQVQDLEDKLMSGTPLSESEQEFYDSVSMTSLEEKISAIREMMHKQVDDGKITSSEKAVLLEQVNDRLENLSSEIEKATKEGKAKRVENLTAAKAKAEERKEKVQNIKPLAPPPLKNEADINKLRVECGPLLDVEEAAKGRLLTIKESQAVARKDEIVEEVAELEESSRGWFESDDAFEARLAASRSAWEARRKTQKKKKASAPSKGSSTPATKWVTPGARTTKGWATKPKKTNQPRGGGVFAAMMMDSDSD